MTSRIDAPRNLSSSSADLEPSGSTAATLNTSCCHTKLDTIQTSLLYASRLQNRLAISCVFKITTFPHSFSLCLKMKDLRLRSISRLSTNTRKNAELSLKNSTPNIMTPLISKSSLLLLCLPFTLSELRTWIPTHKHSGLSSEKRLQHHVITPF